MTVNYLETFSDLMEGRTHPPPCFCPACLFSEYKKLVEHKKCRHRDSITFYVQWLMYEVRRKHLLETNKAKEIEYRPGVKFLDTPNPHDFEKAPYLAETKRVLKAVYSRFPKCWGPKLAFDAFLSNLASNLGKLKRDESFFKVMNILMTQIYHSQKPKPALDGEDIKLAGRVSNFIKSKKVVSQRELLRHFSNKKLDDILRLLILLRMAGIERKKEGRRFVFQPRPNWAVAKIPKHQ